MSTPGPERVPSTVKVDKTSGQGKPPAAKSTGAKSAGAKSGGKPGSRPPQGKGKGRKPTAPVTVKGSRNWGPIAVAGVVVLLAVGIIGYGVFAATKSAKETGTPWADRAAKIQGIVNYRTNADKSLTAQDHVAGPQTYKISPPVGGAHNVRWQNCQGMVYDAPVPKEHAVHSMEHGAVWVTYRPGLPADQVQKLADKVKGKDFMLMSPYEGLDKPISLQAWGYQLKLDSVDDSRIDEFIRALRVQASMEPAAGCASDQTSTGNTPTDG